MTLHDHFTIIDYKLLPCSKTSKKKDMKRMLTSSHSEDWVSWTVMRMLQRRGTTKWWPKVVDVALVHGANTKDLYHSLPNVDMWRSVPSPYEYERASRVRMKKSSNPDWNIRATNRKAVEGNTEVDIVFSSSDYLIFVEAKLLSPISRRTKYDPDRNQILRNIDCVIEEAGARKPHFWMFVKDRDPRYRDPNSLHYSDLIQQYRSDPESLASKLPHRDFDTLAYIAQGIAVIEWRDLISILPDMPNDTSVLRELQHRVGTAA